MRPELRPSRSGPARPCALVSPRLSSLTACVLLLTTLLVGVPPAATAQSGGDPAGPELWRLRGTDPSLPQDDLAPLLRAIGKSSVVGLGESIHTSGGFYQMKHRVIRDLVQNAGFRVVAFETGWFGGDKLEAYLQKCSGSPEPAMQSIFGIWQSTEVRDLFTWMCSWNRAHRKAADRVHFMGFDIQNDFGQIAENAKVLRAFLRRIGVPATDPRAADLGACDGVVRSVPFGDIAPEDYTPCIAALRAIDELFTTQAATIARRAPKKDFAWAKLHRLGMEAWEEASFQLHRNGTAYNNARDRGMAATFLGIRDLRFPKAKTVVWAHNAHVSTASFDPLIPGLEWMGSLLRAALGDGYFAVAQAAKETEIDWLLGCGRLDTFGANPSIENTLHNLGEGDLLLDLPQATAIPSGVQNLGDERVMAARQWNALIYLERSPKMHPLAWPSCDGTR